MSKRKEGFISVIAVFSFVGIMLGVATLIIVMSVMNGFRSELIERMLGMNAHMTIYNRSGKIFNYDEEILKIQKIKDIEHANVFVEGQVMASTKVNATGAIVKGIKKEDLVKKALVMDNLTGSLDEFSNNNVIVIGMGLARALNINIGSNVKLIAPETNNTMIGAIPRMKTYKVVGFFESGMYEYDNTTIFMPLKAAQVHFKYRDSVSGIEVMANDVENIEDVSYRLWKIYEDQSEDFKIIDWKQANASFIGALKVERNVMFIILTLIILVAAFNIISSLIMLVNDKSKNIALLRTMGATKSSVMRIFFICGSMIGILGTLFGVLLGVSFATNIQAIKKFLENITGVNLFDPTIYFLSNLPSEIFLTDVILVVSMSIGLSFLATIYPSYKATKQNPAEVLRYE
ncbi:lipoprotein-releasing ABC transporter permease subunit [Pseudomonadota bacterium]